MKDNGGGISANAYEGDYKHRPSSDTPVLTITGPAGTGLYSETICFEDVSVANNNLDNPVWDSGSYRVVYNGKTVTFDQTSGVPISYFMKKSVLLEKLGY